MRPIRRIRLGLAIVLALMAVPAHTPPVLAAEGQAQVQHVPEDSAEASISLGEGRTLEIAGARVFGQGGALLCTFEAVIANDSGSDMALRDYYFAVRTSSGEAVDFKLLPEDRNRLTIPAGTAAAYRFYGAVGSEAEARGLRLEANRWDFSLAGLYAKLGEAPLFAGGSGLEQATAPAGGVLLPGSSSAPVWWREDGQLEAVWTLTLKNPSGRPVTLPEWSFWLEDGEGGRIYSLTPDRKPAGTVIEPGGELDIALTAVLPEGLALEKPALVLARTVQEAGAEVPVAAFSIPGIIGDESDGSSRSIATESGTFTAELTALERWPWTDQDLITAAVTLTNTSSKAVAVPQLEGVLVADGAVEWTARTVRGDSVRLLQPGQSSLLFVQAKVDPEEAVALWDVRLQAMAEAEGGAAAKPLCRVEWSGLAAAAAKELPAGSPAKLPNTAAGWAWTASAPIIYESASEQLVAVRMDAVNGEKRYAPPGQWVAQFRTADGTMYPAEMETTSKRVIPSGTASLVAWTRLPKGVALDGLGLMLGQAVTGTNLSQPEEKPDAFLQAALFQLPGRQESGEKPGDLMKPVNLYPYTFEITDMIRPAWFYNDKKALFQLNYSFEYMLAKQWNVVSEMKSRRVVLQLLDGQNHLIQEKSYELDPQDAAADGLQLDQDKKEWIVEIKDLSLDLSSFTVALYEEFLPGFRRLIGSTTSEWY